MTEKPLVSIIINCYNGERYLRETIDSVMAQTYDNWELIFWDNQSTDSTREIVESYHESRIHYLYAPKHTPLGEARNLAMKTVTGNYLTFLDADDVWIKDFLRRGLDVLCNNPVIKAYYSNYYCKYPNYSKIWINNKQTGVRTINDLVRSYDVAMSGCIVSMSIIRDNNILFKNDFQLIEDFDYYVNIALHTDYFYDNTPLLYYRIHESTSIKYRGKWYHEFKHFYAFLEGLKNRNILNDSDLNEIRMKLFITKLDENIEKGERMKCFINLIRNNKYLRYSWKYFFYVLFGTKVFDYIKHNDLKKLFISFFSSK